MTTFLEVLAADLAATQYDTDTLAKTVSYNDGTGAEDIVADVDTMVDSQKYPGVHRQIYVKKTDVPVPAYRHTVVIDSIIYYVTEPGGKTECYREADPLTWQIDLIANEGATAWRQ